MNDTASLIWERCNGEEDPSQITAAVLGVFNVDVETARQDVARILLEFSALGLLEVHGPSKLPTDRAIGEDASGQPAIQ
jgi:hypothetical protein